MRVYKEEEIHLIGHWRDYAHTLDPKNLSPEALEEIAQIRKEKHLDIITLELMTEIKKHYCLNWLGTHGLPHWHRVYTNGLRLSEQEGVNVKVVQLFSVFHDSQRRNEGTDEGHGSRGAQLALKLRDLCSVDDDEFELLTMACGLHTSARTHEDITVQACFDSDRLDLGRVGNYPDPNFLCTPMAKEKKTIEWAYHQSLNSSLPAMPFGLAGLLEG